MTIHIYKVVYTEFGIGMRYAAESIGIIILNPQKFMHFPVLGR